MEVVSLQTILNNNTMCVHGIPKADTIGEDAVEADNIITELWKALEITMQAYHDTHPKYIMAEKALKKARGEK